MSNNNKNHDEEEHKRKEDAECEILRKQREKFSWKDPADYDEKVSEYKLLCLFCVLNT